jgi:hypothetical protein
MNEVEFITKCDVFKYCEKGSVLNAKKEPTCIGCNTWKKEKWKYTSCSEKGEEK